jgi:hypothetical protein
MSKNLIFVFSFFLLINTSNARISDGGTHEKWEFVLEDTSDVLQLALPIATGLTTIIKKDWKGTKQFALSYTTGFIVTHSLKKIIKKQRPEGRNLYDAFPSGHTTQRFL